jgi:hypothetical protein
VARLQRPAQQLPPVPNGYDHGGYQKSFIGTGKFKMTSYTRMWAPPSPGTRTTGAHPALPARTERRIAGQIEQLLLDETPIIYPYFCDYLSATQKNVTGVGPTATGELFLWNAAKS